MSSTIGRYGVAGAIGVLLTAAAPASAQRDRDDRLRFLGLPEISGPAVVGGTLSVSGAPYYSPRPRDTSSEWQWWRCPNRWAWRCDVISRGPSTYALTEADRGRWIAAARLIRLGRDSELTVSRTTGPIAAAPPRPTPTPTPTPVPTASPSPVPPPEPFVVPAPVATQGEILDQAAINRAIRPFPVVRMRGELTLNGARVTLLSVKAPRKAKVTVRCKGSCPRRRWAPKVRRKQVTRVRRFERTLRAGTRITISVTRKGLIGKRTTFVIRRGKVPARYDRCLTPRGKARRCPGA